MRPPYQSADDRRSETVDVVVDLASQMNPVEITTGAIAKRMGLTQAAVFRHFPTKDSIFETVAEWIAATLTARLDAAAASADRPLDQIEAMFTAHIDFVARFPGVPRMMLGEMQRAGDSLAKRVVQRLITGYTDKVAALIEAAKDRAEIAPGLASASAAQVYIGMIQGQVLQSLLTGRTAELRQDAQAALAIWRRGITRQGGGTDHAEAKTPSQN